jgi:hypothetical protein
MSLTRLSNVVAYACRPLSLEGSASWSRASMICLQRQHAMAQHRPSHPAAFPGLYTVYKNSRSPAGAPAQCCFVFSALVGVTLAEIAEIGAVRRPPETLVVPGRQPEFQPLTFLRAAYVPKCAPSTAAASSLALSPCCRKRVSEKKPWIVPG